MNEAQSIQWFPGHMAKTKKQIEKNLKLVDAVAEILDARVPASSRNPVLDRLVGNKPRIILMNKCDMADPSRTARWISAFRERGITAIAVDCHTGKGLSAFLPAVKGVLAEQIARWKEKGMSGRKIRIMVVGIPNVGKSSLINRLSKRGRAAVQDRPGVTRREQWFSAGGELEILDTPGVLWPKFEDPSVGEKLAFTGAVKDEILDTERLAGSLLEVLRDGYPKNLRQRFKLEEADLSGAPGYNILERIGKKRGMLVSGGEVDTLRAAGMVLDEFRSAKIGRITLEQAG